MIKIAYAVSVFMMLNLSLCAAEIKQDDTAVKSFTGTPISEILNTHESVLNKLIIDITKMKSNYKELSKKYTSLMNDYEQLEADINKTKVAQKSTVNTNQNSALETKYDNAFKAYLQSNKKK